MRCENCKSETFLNLRVSISSIQDAFHKHHGLGTINLDRAKVEKVLQDGEKDLEDFATEILRLQSRILFIERQRDCLKCHLKDYGSLISPVRRLPNYILRVVFGYYNELHKSSTLERLRIAGVCSHWRSIIMSTPSFWSRITFRFNKNCLPKLPILQVFLNRSKQLPLDLDLHIVLPDDRSRREEVLGHPATKALAGQFHRLEKLTLFGDYVPFLKHHTFWSCPALKHLSLSSSNLAETPPALDFLRMPKLHSFAAIAIDTQYCVHPTFPWYQLTELSLRSHSSIPQFLEACYNLTTLHLYLDLNDSYPENVVASSVHSRVRTLVLFFAYANPGLEDDESDIVLPKVFRQFTFPNLTSFQFIPESTWEDSLPTWPSDTMDAFSDFIRRSGSKLTILSLVDLSIPYPALMTILRAVPSVIQLTLGDCSDIEEDEQSSTLSPAFLQSLHTFRRSDGHSQAPDPLLPKLQRLYLHLYGVFDAEAFVDAITSRWIPSEEYAKDIGIVSLRKVELRLENEEPDEDVLDELRPLKALRNQGLVVDISGCGSYMDL